MRITVDMVREAYATLGAKPIQGSFGEPEACCGLGAICYNYNIKTGQIVFLEYLLGQSYRMGFISGFDGKNIGGGLATNKERYMEGYEDGKAAWEAVS